MKYRKMQIDKTLKISIIVMFNILMLGFVGLSIYQWALHFNTRTDLIGMVVVGIILVLAFIGFSLVSLFEWLEE